MTTRRRLVSAVFVALAVTATVVAVGVPVAGAQGSSPPIGYLDAVSVRGTVVTVVGWTLDPDHTAAVNVQVTVDGAVAATVAANGARPDVAAAVTGAGPNHGFTAAVPGVAPGTRVVCVTALDSAGPPHRELGCRTVVVQPPGPPVGWLDAVAPQQDGSLRIVGWTADPDVDQSVAVHVYVDGVFARGATAGGHRPDVGSALPQFGADRGFDIVVPSMSPGLHTACVFALDPVAPPHRNLGCRGVVVSGPGGLAPLGFVDRFDLVSNGTQVVASGWAVDPDVAGPVTVELLVDDTLTASTAANQPRPDVSAAYPALGANRGFSLTSAVPVGDHQVCVRAVDAVSGASTILACRLLIRQVPQGGRVLAIGDSVMLGAKFGLENAPGLWDITVDATVSRQFTAGIPLMAAAGSYDRVVVGLGTNGPFSSATFDSAMQTLVGAGFSPNEVVFVTIQLPDARYPHEAPTNAVIRDGVNRWGARLADWNALSGANPSWLYTDGTHLTAAGANGYTAMILGALG